MAFIIPREQWGAPHNRVLTLDSTPKDDRVIIHTEAGAIGKEGATLEQDIAHMKAIDAFHYYNRGWKGGVGYQFVIMQSGRIFEGRGWRYSGGHTVGLNTESGFCFAGHGDQVDATKAQWDSMRWLIKESIRKGFLSEFFKLSGHRDHIPPGTKSCPGSIIYKKMHTELSMERILLDEPKEELMASEIEELHEHIDLAVMAITGSQFAPGKLPETDVFGINDLLEAQKLANLDLAVKVLKKIAEEGVPLTDLSEKELADLLMQRLQAETDLP